METDNEMAILCKHIVTNERPIELVVRHSDGGWQMTCGKFDHLESADEYVTAHVHHVFEYNPYISGLSDLPAGYMAEKQGEDWNILKHDE